MPNKFDRSYLKTRNRFEAKWRAKDAIEKLNSILDDLEKDDGSFIYTKGVDKDIADVIMSIAALNTLNDYTA